MAVPRLRWPGIEGPRPPRHGISSIPGHRDLGPAIPSRQRPGILGGGGDMVMEDWVGGTLVPQFESRIISDSSIREKHELWIARNGREYKDTAEKNERYEIFKANIEYINLVNNVGNKPYQHRLEKTRSCNFDQGRNMWAEGNDCDGGFVSEAFDFIKQNGLTTESNYPSKEKPGTCDKKKEAHVAKISSYEKIPADNEAALMKAVANQPIAVSLDASGPSFQFYSSGVFTGQCGTTLNHGVTVVGYGTENGKLKYWIIKNSWGTTWGEEGYMRLQRDTDEKKGLCGIV
ncbi:hypothetical protein RD792_005862 [Penstemon davidsonii]|uniref:Peptidase C1A papain C-terminal domain-containing protein n=1 Tax=Penstemon davidsonii TaxID=160366 RepID=A0ABR0DEW6_9LAMI|nr:hypothetical protein RD792_005862 [Penstemon davidsonii]